MFGEQYCTAFHTFAVCRTFRVVEDNLELLKKKKVEQQSELTALETNCAHVPKRFILCFVHLPDPSSEQSARWGHKKLGGLELRTSNGCIMAESL